MPHNDGRPTELDFVDLMKEYRKLDDSVTMRMNRSNAQFRDRQRLGSGSSKDPQDEACLYMWRQLVGAFVTPVNM